MTLGFNFEAVDATDYEELRPGYAPEAVAWVAQEGGLSTGSLVVDLAAGTGQLSRLFGLLDMSVVAVEPAANMRDVLRERLACVRVVGGVAESIPLRDRAADAVVVGNAFHHFDRRVAFTDIGRVLQTGGVLALFWARPLEDEQVRRYPVLRRLQEVEAVRVTSPASARIVAAYRSWAATPPSADGFGPFQRREFALTHVLPSARLADLWATSSDVAALPPAARSDVLRRIREIASELPPILRLPSRSVVDLCHRG